MGYAIISEHREALLVSPFVTHADVSICTNEVSREDLRALIEENLVTLINGLVTEARQVLYDELYELCAIIVARLNEFYEAAFEELLQYFTKLSE